MKCLIESRIRGNGLQKTGEGEKGGGEGRGGEWVQRRHLSHETR